MKKDTTPRPAPKRDGREAWWCFTHSSFFYGDPKPECSYISEDGELVKPARKEGERMKKLVKPHSSHKMTKWVKKSPRWRRRSCKLCGLVEEQFSNELIHSTLLEDPCQNNLEERKRTAEREIGAAVLSARDVLDLITRFWSSELIGNSEKRKLYDVFCGLRGPDSETAQAQDAKRAITAVLRGEVFGADLMMKTFMCDAARDTATRSAARRRSTSVALTPFSASHYFQHARQAFRAADIEW